MKVTSKKIRVGFVGGLALFILLPLPGRALTQNCVPPPAGLASWWPGDGNANDIQGGKDGSLQGGAGFAPGMVGSAFSFDGTGYVSLPTSAILDGSSQASVDAWIKPDVGFEAANFRAIYYESTANTSNTFVFQTNWMGGELRLYLAGAGLPDACQSSQALPGGQWSHVAGTYDGTQIKLYINGPGANVPGWLRSDSGCRHSKEYWPL